MVDILKKRRNARRLLIKRTVKGTLEVPRKHH
jgi:hypothetical protein